MDRAITAGSRLRQLVAAGTLPESTQLEGRRRRCFWQERGMPMQLSLEPLATPDPTGPAPWTLFVSPGGVLGLPPENGGAGTVVAVHPVPTADAASASWASGAGFERLLVGARHFVADEDDLCWLLLERSDVVRGELSTWQYQRFAARLVKALLLARHTGNFEAEERALAVLHSGEEVQVSPTTRESLLEVARRRAQEISRDTGLHIAF